jgi:hypothetical protein
VRKDYGRVILGDEASQRLTKVIGSDPLDFIHNITENLKKRGITDPRILAYALAEINRRKRALDDLMTALNGLPSPELQPR